MHRKIMILASICCLLAIALILLKQPPTAPTVVDPDLKEGNAISKPPSIPNEAPVVANSDTPDILLIPGLGPFRADRDNRSATVDCFQKDHTFKSQTVSLIVYPNNNGTWPSESQRQRLMQRFASFEGAVDVALQQLPAHLKPLCNQYEIDVDHLTPQQIIDGLEWHNVKLEPNGEIECYTMNKRVSLNLDIVIRFSRTNTISEVYFDG